MSKLDNCPFCGSSAEMKVERHIPKGMDYTPRCTNTSCPGRISKKWSSAEIATQMWNKRAGNTQQLVHCRDCTLYRPEPMGDVMMCYSSGNWPNPDDFCSRGVRRTDNE